MSWNSPTDAVLGTRRQRIVLHLAEMETPVTIDEVVDVLDADPHVRYDDPGAPGSWDDLHRELYEFDLPALDDAGVITFDADRGLVAQPDESLVEDVLPTGGEPDSDATAAEEGRASTPWATVYLGLSALALLLLGLVEANVVPVPAESAVGAAGVVVGL
ncbi:MAG: hypothetical protein ABEJ31_10465, partial [Haloarculaceae archaeon]